jgi:MSHA biogenesis protein MshI
VTAQVVNLFQPGLRAPAPALSARLIVRAFAGVALVLLVIYGIARTRAGSERETIVTLEAQRTQTTQRLEELEKQVATRAPDAALAAEVKALTADTEQRRVLVRAVEQRALGTTQGFSPQLAGLARRRVPGVWLGRIRIDRGGDGLALSGHALEAKLVPEWLQELREEPGFSGRAFQTVRIEKGDPEKSKTPPGAIDFALATGDEARP